MKAPHRIPLYLLAVAALSLSPAPLSADGTGVIERRMLSWSDFVGTPDAASPYDAYTWWTVHYDYTWTAGPAGSADVTVTVSNRLSEESWVRRPLPPNQVSLLRHEQGHYDFSVLVALDFRRAVAGTRFSAALVDQTLADLFGAALERCKALELRYDEETAHGADPEAQARWNAWFESEIRRLWEWR